MTQKQKVVNEKLDRCQTLEFVTTSFQTFSAIVCVDNYKLHKNILIHTVIRNMLITQAPP